MSKINNAELGLTRPPDSSGGYYIVQYRVPEEHRCGGREWNDVPGICGFMGDLPGARQRRGEWDIAHSSLPGWESRIVDRRPGPDASVYDDPVDTEPTPQLLACQAADAIYTNIRWPRLHPELTNDKPNKSQREIYRLVRDSDPAILQAELARLLSYEDSK